MIPGLCSAFYKGRTMGSFSVVASPPSTTTVDTPGTLTSPTYTATATGGAPAYSNLWVYQSGVVLTINSSTSATTTFSTTLSFSRESTTSTYLCQVTDSGSTVAVSNLVTIIFRTAA